MTDANNDLLREFWIHRDGLELGPPTGKPNNLYLFPLLASVRDADGLQARMRITAQRAEKVEFVKAVWVMNDDLAVALAEHFAEYRRYWTAPRGSFPVREWGEPMSGALGALGSLTPENIRPAIQLQLMHFADSVRRLKAAWRRLSPEFRAQVAEHFEQLDHGGENWVWKAIAELELMPK
jgi:hypothetical protein